MNRTIDKSVAIKFCFLMLMTGFVILPMIVTVFGGFKGLGELRTNPFGIPSQWEFEHYSEILGQGTIWALLWNSLVISASSVFLTLALGSMAAFVFAQIRFFGSKMAFNYLLVGMMFPAATAILPLFIKVRDLQLLDTYAGVVLPQAAFGMGFSILLFKTFFDQLPKELFEAAFLDGCGYAKFFWKFTIPLSTPILATVAVFTLVNSWNNYIIPLIMLNDDNMYPWTLGIMQFRGEYGTAWNKILAYITITIAPAVLFFLMAQRYLVAGLSQGAVKG